MPTHTAQKFAAEFAAAWGLDKDQEAYAAQMADVCIAAGMRKIAQRMEQYTTIDGFPPDRVREIADSWAQGRAT